MKSIAYITVAVIIAAAVYLLFIHKPPQVAVDQSAGTSEESLLPEDNSDNPESEESESSFIVTYSDGKYEPSVFMVSPGTTVTFVNESEDEMWPASDPHPVHTDYAAFDSREGVENGGTYSFTFEEEGVYRFHDHLAPSRTGVITVE